MRVIKKILNLEKQLETTEIAVKQVTYIDGELVIELFGDFDEIKEEPVKQSLFYELDTDEEGFINDEREE